MWSFVPICLMDPVLIAAESDQGWWSGCPALTLVTAGWWLRCAYRSWLNLAKAQCLQPSLGNPLAPRTEVLKNWGRTRPRPNYSLCCLAKKGMQGISSHSRGMQTFVNHKNKTLWYPLQTQQDLWPVALRTAEWIAWSISASQFILRESPQLCDRNVKEERFFWALLLLEVGPLLKPCEQLRARMAACNWKQLRFAQRWIWKRKVV